VIRRVFHKSIFFAIVLAASGVSWALDGPGSSVAQTAQDEYALKAAYIYNFCNYVTWPTHVAPDKFTVGVIGPALKSPNTISKIRKLNGLFAKNRKITIHEIGTVEEYKPCDIVFVTGAEPDSLDLVAKLVKITDKKPVLVVTEVTNGMKQGAIINLVIVGGRIRYEINLPAAKAVDLEISSKVLRNSLNKL